MKRFGNIIVVSLIILFAGFKSDLKPHQVKTIVLDAGHGGHDSGCLGSSKKEKDITLALARKVGKLLEDNHPDLKVIYTRNEDKFIELHERANIANRAKADVFISIHCNAGPKAAHGTETYVMGMHKSSANFEVAKRENSVIKLEKNYKEIYEGFDNSEESHIILNLVASSNRGQSLALAEKVEREFSKQEKRFSRGVKEAGFLVLYKTAMPSVLIESGFLTNAEEEKFLASSQGQDRMANAIYRAIKDFKETADRRN